jgi:hypothetical protein
MPSGGRLLKRAGYFLIGLGLDLELNEAKR